MSEQPHPATSDILRLICDMCGGITMNDTDEEDTFEMSAMYPLLVVVTTDETH